MVVHNVDCHAANNTSIFKLECCHEKVVMWLCCAAKGQSHVPTNTLLATSQPRVPTINPWHKAGKATCSAWPSQTTHTNSQWPNLTHMSQPYLLIGNPSQNPQRLQKKTGADKSFTIAVVVVIVAAVVVVVVNVPIVAVAAAVVIAVVVAVAAAQWTMRIHFFNCALST